jgi:DNA-binding MarR family transcriptional regulator
VKPTHHGRGDPEPVTAVEAVRALARMARALERASDELSLAQYRVLSAIASGAERASRVAERLQLGRPTVSAAVDALCREGLVQRAEAPGDQRAVSLVLTSDGAALLRRMERAMVAVLDELCARAGDRDLTDRLAALGPALDALGAERLGRIRGQARSGSAGSRPG